MSHTPYNFSVKKKMDKIKIFTDPIDSEVFFSLSTIREPQHRRDHDWFLR